MGGVNLFDRGRSKHGKIFSMPVSTERKLVLGERLFSKERCLELARRAQERIRKLGSDSRIVRSEDGHVNWTLLFCQSLLGERLKDPPVRVIPSALTLKEQELLGRMRNGGKVDIIVWADFDGVFVSPAASWKLSGKIDLITGLGMKEMIKTADRVVFRTSRWLVSDDLSEERWPARVAMEPLVDQLTRFPFFDASSMALLQKMAPEKIEVQHKPLLGEDKILKREIREIMHSGNLGQTVIYSLISSEKDRREAEGLLQEFPTVAPSLVFFDTAHYYL